MAYFAVSVWDGKKYVIDPERVFHECEKAHGSKRADESSIVTLYSKTQLILELASVGVEIEVKGLIVK